ncbi:MAG: poly-gamma-glutamate system protein [Planctomycetota bacterium]
MKSLYYRPQKVSNAAFMVMAVSTALTLLLVHRFSRETSPWARERMLEAAYRTEACFETIQCRRFELGHQMLLSQDPARTGMLGPSMSMVTTLPGHLDAKQTSVNANFAAVAVKMFLDAGAKPGDRVAIGMTGSFPALNIAVLQACESLELRPSIVSSAASSQFGANHPEMMWPDMEKILFSEDLLSQRSLLTSPGGFRDSASGMTEDTHALLVDAIQRNDCVELESESLTNSIEQRMKAFDEAAGEEPYVAYVNVGGGAASVGGTLGNDHWGSGVVKLTAAADRPAQLDCVAVRFMQRQVPLINMVGAVEIARRHDMAVVPLVRPMVGESSVYQRSRVHRGIAMAGIIVLLVTTWMAVRPPNAVVALLHRLGCWKSADRRPRWTV